MKISLRLVDSAAVSQGPTPPGEELLFGRIAVHLKFITAQDLAMVTSAQQRAGVWRPLGEMLIDEGLLTEDQVQYVLAFQRERVAAAGAATKPAATSTTPATSTAATSSKPAASTTATPTSSTSTKTAAPSDAIRAFAMEDDEPPAPSRAAAPASTPGFRAPPTSNTSNSTSASTTVAPPGATPGFRAPPTSNATMAPASTPGLRAPPSSNPFQAAKSDPSAAASTSTPAFRPPPPSGFGAPRTDPGAGAPAAPALTVVPASAPLPPRPANAVAVVVVDEQGRPVPRSTTDTAPLHRVLRAAIAENASDIHMHSGARLRFRINGALREMSDELLSPWHVGPTVLAALTESEYEQFCADGEVDFPYTAAGIGRFRCNLYRQQHGIDAVFRSVPDRPPSLADLGLPAALGKLANYHQGIVLFTGPSGCGKSATMNAVLNLVNQDRTDHILTIEDPVEVLHESAQSIVNQRQAKTHTASFGRALRAALREDPDVICIGEMRDFETISLAVSAAETGHLVMGTLHTSSAIRTIGRVLGVFPPNQQDQVRSMVAESLRAIVSQRLVARADGKGRVAALEILYVNQAVANLIRENRTMMIKSVLQTGQASGMCSLDNSLEALVKDGTITKQEAARHAEEPKKFQ